MPRELTDVLRNIESIIQSNDHADEEFAKYLVDVGVGSPEDWRSEVHSLLQQANEVYRGGMLSKLRTGAAIIRDVDLESPLSNLISAALAQGQHLMSRLIQVNSILEDRRSALPPQVQDELRAQVSSVADLVKSVRMRSQASRQEYLAMRPQIAGILSESAFETMMVPLKSPLPSRSQRRPLNRVAEKIRAQHAIRQGIVKKAQRMHQVVSELDTSTMPEVFVEEVRQLDRRMQRERWRLNDLVFELEERFIVAETTPSLLPLDGRLVSPDGVLLAIKKYERLRAGLNVLRERSLSVEQRLDSLCAALHEQ